MTKNNRLASLKKDFIAALRIIFHEGLSDAFAHLSARVDGGKKMLFMPRKSPALVKASELFVVEFDKPVPQSAVHQAVYKVRDDVEAVIHFHSPAVILLSVVGQTVQPMHNYSATISDPSERTLTGNGSAGLELAVTREMGKLFHTRVLWSLTAGVSDAAQRLVALLCHLLQERHLRAFRREQLRDSLPDTGAGSRDYRDAPFKSLAGQWILLKHKGAWP